jgi:hypothetical protein
MAESHSAGEDLAPGVMHLLSAVLLPLDEATEFADSLPTEVAKLVV